MFIINIKRVYVNVSTSLFGSTDMQTFEEIFVFHVQPYAKIVFAPKSFVLLSFSSKY